MSPAPEALRVRLARFMRSSIVGILATIVDLAVFELCFRLIGLSPTLSKLVSLGLGTTTQFVGSRYFAFRAQAGRLSRQMVWFAVAEFVAFWVTMVVFHFLAKWMPGPKEIPSLLSGSIVYTLFSYPLWNWVFALRAHERASAPGRAAVAYATTSVVTTASSAAPSSSSDATPTP